MKRATLRWSGAAVVLGGLAVLGGGCQNPQGFWDQFALGLPVALVELAFALLDFLTLS
ncbi:MAG: hypothetical protein GXY33_08580 [Phycisphaerae bacterium]|nr:hypothetical protein [Phycisphaerae bacterium]